jgi:hypothetical protein
MNQSASLAVSKEGLWLNHRAPPNNRMQRGVRDKVLRRGQDGSLRKIFMRARVREALCPRADAER